MALNNYTNLQTAIANWLNRGDLTAQIPDFITLLESELKRSRAIEFTRSTNFTISAEVTPLPADLRQLLAIGFDDGTRYGPIEIISVGQLAQKKFMLGDTGYPRFAAVIDNSTAIKFSPAPDVTTYVVPIEYDTKLPTLSNATASNWLLDDYSDIYLFGSLMQAEPFLKNDERISMWETKLNNALASLQDFIERRKYSANTMVRRPRRAIG